ncbi:Bsp6I family type II restriction endonuclease [Acinetobacter sp. TY1]|uniref:Bsp6I family type II restriction endonuclease n=1 Tax=unclassified Acinetobacter TaxID=196816 RepID=UPI0039176C85
MATNVTTQDLTLILESYKAWKWLNVSLSHFASRTVNFPEAISESLCCYTLRYTWHNKAKTKLPGDGTGLNGELVEIKATSNFNHDLTSFSPDIRFDILIFARLDLVNNHLYIYDMNMNFSQFQLCPVNLNETVLDHQNQGRRPRLSLINQINQRNLQPVTVLDLNQLALQLGIQL